MSLSSVGAIAILTGCISNSVEPGKIPMPAGDEITAVYTVEVEGKEHYWISIFEPHLILEQGIPTLSVLGSLAVGLKDGGQITSENFQENELFVEFLISVIEKHGPDSPDLKAEAHRQHDGFVFIIDGRAPNPAGELSEMGEDIIGWFRVENGEVIPGSYGHNGRHALVSANGVMKLDAFLRERLLAELRQLPPAK